jgi:hypothetical protein
MNDMNNLAVTQLMVTSNPLTPLDKPDHVDCQTTGFSNPMQVAFGACTVSCEPSAKQNGNCKKGDTVTVVFSDPMIGGILPGQMLFIDLDTIFGNHDNGGGWKGDKKHPGNGVSSFSVQATFTPVPEPGSLLLVLAGLAGASLLCRRS